MVWQGTPDCIFAVVAVDCANSSCHVRRGWIWQTFTWALLMVAFYTIYAVWSVTTVNSYIAFVLMSNSLWYMFDDAHILCVGLWADVVNRCELGRIQASVLFFEQLRV